MRKIRKRVFATVLATALLFTMPGMASYAEAETAQTEDISESVAVLAEYDAAEETEAENEVIQETEAEDSDTDKPGTGEDDAGDADAQELAEEETAPTPKEDVKECTCGTLCTQDSINGDCPVCGAENADLSCCVGEKTENKSEENKEDAEQGDTGAQDAGTNLCAHHREHTQDCGYSPASENGEGSPCAYECRICLIEDLIAALPGALTEANRAEVEAQLQEILDLYRELTEEEQGQIDMTLCWDLQAELDPANAPMTAAVGNVELSMSNITVTFTTEECGDNCQGHIITQTGALQAATVIVESGTHNVIFSGLDITPNARVGVMPGATMNLTLQGTNTINGYNSGIYVPEGATLFIGGSGSLTVVAAAGSVAAGIGGAYYAPNGELGNRNCGTVVINGGNITATGGSCCAGIGGAGADFDTKIPGNGGNITINGGNVTATGGGDSYYGGAGIGGGNYGSKSGSGGTLTINGGNVTLTSGHSSAYGFGRGSGSNSNAGTLTLADASYLTLTDGTTLDPKGNYSINGGPTEDMIVVPTDLVYTGQTHDLTGKIYIDDSKTGTAEYFEQTFNVTASADGWVLQDLGEVVEAGDYTVTFTKGGKSISATFTVAECPHTGLVYESQENNKHGGTCPDCGTEVSEEHTWADGVCSVCNLKAVAQVQTSDGTIVYLGEGDFANAFDDRKYNNVTVTLLSDIQADSIEMDDTQASVHVLNTSTLDLAGHTITSSDTAIYVYPTGNLTIQDSSSGKTGQVISISSAAIVLQTGMVSLAGGTYTGIPTIDGKASSTNVSSLLANYGTQTTPHYAYFGEAGKPIALEEGQTTLTGTVTVQECHHEGVKATPNNNGTHSLNCPYCGYTETSENCTYGTEYQHDDTNHWQTCAVCGYQKTEMHTLNLKQGDTVNGVTQNREACDCGFFNAFTVTVTVPSGLTYGNTGGKRVAYTVNPVKSGDAEWELTDMQGKVLEMEDDTLPANLTAGDYRLWIYGSNDSKYVFVGTTIFTVCPATLTGEMVTLSTESVTYSGAEQKPTITVKHGETTLAPGTDYDVTYSTTDFTNAGTITVTITGKGNYTGTAETTYIIKKAPLTITASDQTITYGGSITQGAGNVTVAGLCTGDVLESITLTASTANAPGGNITPSAAGIKNSGGGDVTGNYEITYKDGGLTINKADAEITVGTDTYNKTFGDAAFTLDIMDNNTEADMQYEVTARADVVSVSDGTVTILNAGTASITVSLPESANYNAAGSKTITVNVAKKEGYTVDEINNSYYFDKQSTAKINLAGLLPADCGAVSYGPPTTAGDVTYSVEPAVNGKELSYTVDKGSADEKGTITVVAVTRNYADITVTVVITRSSCDHVAKEELFYTGKGEKAPTCTEGGLGHRECAECGAVIESGVLAAALGHDYRGEMTTEPTVSTEGEKTYICVRCGDTYTETVPRRPEGLWISGLEQSYSYTGSAIRPGGIRVYHGATRLREKTDYTISYKNNTKAGAAQIIVTGKGSYKGKAAADFTIEAVDLRTDPNISYNITTVMETGKNLKPTLTVSWKGKKLKEKTDYTLSYEANIKTASAEGYDVTITGKGNYTGAIVEKFYVAPKGTPLLSKATVKGLAKSYPYCENRIPEGLEAALENLTVKVGKTTLTKEDYTVRLENVSAVGTGTVVIEAAPGSMYAGQKRVTFNITGTSLKNGSIIGLEKTYPYTGSPVEPQIRVYSGKKGAGEQIPSDSYTVSYSNSIGNGKAKVTVTGIAAKGCSGSLSATYTIGKLSIADEGVTVEMSDTIEYAKGGAKPQPVITHIHDGRAAILREGVDYTLKYSNNTSAGGTKKPTVKITGTGNYSGTVTREYEITGQDIGRLAITAADKAYNSKKKGSYYYSAPKVYDLDGKLLKLGTDYTVQYFDASTGQEIGKNDAVAQGTEIRVTATGKGSYRGALSGTYRVLAAGNVKDIGKAKNEKIANQPYTGAGIRPEIRLYTMTGKTKTDLAEDTDYEIIGFYNNIKKGTATVLIRGKGAYSGVKSITFKIVAVDNGSIWKGVF